eukprot:Awhi_evm1s8538
MRNIPPLPGQNCVSEIISIAIRSETRNRNALNAFDFKPASVRSEGNEDEESTSEEEEEESEAEKVDKGSFLDLIRNRSSQEGRSPERTLAGLKSKALRAPRLRISERIAMETISETRAVGKLGCVVAYPKM